jgi:hypothetical protein
MYLKKLRAKIRILNVIIKSKTAKVKVRKMYNKRKLGQSYQAELKMPADGRWDLTPAFKGLSSPLNPTSSFRKSISSSPLYRVTIKEIDTFNVM